MIEDHRSRRGEPVIVLCDDGIEHEGTIEFGDDTTSSISVYTERDGRSTGRMQVPPSRVRPDPGGRRPVWKG